MIILLDFNAVKYYNLHEVISNMNHILCIIHKVFTSIL